jgi:hypothetical protein
LSKPVGLVSQHQFEKAFEAFYIEYTKCIHQIGLEKSEKIFKKLIESKQDMSLLKKMVDIISSDLH